MYVFKLARRSTSGKNTSKSKRKPENKKQNKEIKYFAL